MFMLESSLGGTGGSRGIYINQSGKATLVRTLTVLGKFNDTVGSVLLPQGSLVKGWHKNPLRPVHGSRQDSSWWF